MEQRLSLVTLGVADVRRRATSTSAGVEVRQRHDARRRVLPGRRHRVALWGRDRACRGFHGHRRGGWGGVTLAYNVALARGGRRGAGGGRGGRRDDRPRRAPRPSGAATRASSSTPTATRGRSPTTRTGRSRTTARCGSSPDRRRQLDPRDPGGAEAARDDREDDRAAPVVAEQGDSGDHGEDERHGSERVLRVPLPRVVRSWSTGGRARRCGTVP